MNGASATGRGVTDDPTYQAFAAIVSRIEIEVEGETNALRNNRPIDLTGVAYRKRQGLLELSRILPRVSGVSLAGAVRHRMSQLDEVLDRNRRTLEVQLQAVREVSDIIARTMREAESDGTYSDWIGRP